MGMQRRARETPHSGRLTLLRHAIRRASRKVREYEDIGQLGQDEPASG